MWQAAPGALVGFLIARWWARRSARKELRMVQEACAARLESSRDELARLREHLDRSRQTIADFERQTRYLESAVVSSADAAARRRTRLARPVTPAG